jgi:hypothetical protein
MLVWFALWALYLSFVNVGSPFYGFVWETLLLEAGFLAIFLGNARIAPPIFTVFLLTVLYYHHETQNSSAYLPPVTLRRPDGSAPHTALAA